MTNTRNLFSFYETIDQASTIDRPAFTVAVVVVAAAVVFRSDLVADCPNFKGLFFNNLCLLSRTVFTIIIGFK